MGTLCGFDSNRRGVVEKTRWERVRRVSDLLLAFTFFLTKPRLAMVVLAF